MIRNVKKQELPELAAFHAREYTPGHILGNERFLEWQYGTYPQKDGELSVIGAFLKDKELVGAFGYFPADFTFFGRTARATCLCNLMVAEKFRAMGYGALLLKAVMRTGEIGIDHGVNASAMRLFEKMGWRTGTLKRFFYIFNPEKTKELIGDTTASVKKSRDIEAPQKNIVFEELSSCDDSFDEFWRRARRRYPITVERTQEYMNWRYAHHPFFHYTILIAKRNHSIEACAVIRIEEPEQKYTAAHIVDFIAVDGMEEIMFSRVIDVCKERKVDWIDYFFSGSFHQSALQRLGFYDGDAEPYNRIPLFLNPIDRSKRVTINIVTAALDKNFSSPEAHTFANWYTTKGGGDQDRP